jgi:hypothetical protein
MGVDGFDNKKTSTKKMPFGDFVNEGRVVKSSFEEESNSSMKIKDAKASEHLGGMSSTLNSYFKIFTIEPTIFVIRMVS